MKTTKTLIFLIALLSIGLLARFLYFEYKLLQYPYQWETAEALQLNHAIILSEGNSLYKIDKEPPLVIEPYGPVTPYLVSPLLKIFGKNFVAPRLVSFASFLFVLFFVAYAVYSLTQNWKFVLLSIGLNLFMLNNFQRLLLCRPDGLGNFFLFLALFLHWKFPYKKIAVFFTILLGILGFFTKIYFACVFGSIVLSYWLIHKDRKMALLYALVSGTLLIAGFLIVNHITDGLYYLFTFEIISGWVSYSFVYLLLILKSLITYYLPIFFLIVYALFKKTFNFKKYGVLSVHLFLCLPLFCFLLLNEGGAFYYWFSIIPVLIIIGCDLICVEIEKLNFRIVIPILFAVVFIMVLRVGYRDIVKNKFVYPTSNMVSEWDPVQELVKKTNGPVMNDGSTAILNILSGKNLYSEGLGYIQTRNYLVQKHNYSFVDINKMIAEKKYALIINPEEEKIVEKYYKLFKTYFVPGQMGEWILKINVFIPQ